MEDLLRENSVYWIAAAASAAVLLAGGALYWWRRRRPGLGNALRSVAVDRLADVLLPDGMGGHIHLEHLLLTTRGILVINVKRYEGVVFASDRMDEWTVISKDGRFGFPNPQGALYDRVAAVRQLIRDVEVTGLLLFPAGADFSKGRPKDVMLAPELAEAYKKPDRSDIERLRRAYAHHWERVREATQPAHTRPPKLG